jgi:hypothetical protein
LHKRVVNRSKKRSLPGYKKYKVEYPCLCVHPRQSGSWQAQSIGKHNLLIHEHFVKKGNKRPDIHDKIYLVVALCQAFACVASHPLYIAVIDRVSFQKGLGVLFVWEQNVQITGWNSNFSLYGYPGKHAIVGEKSTGDADLPGTS